MPLLTRLFIKTSLLYFAGALLLAVLLSAQPFIGLPPFIAAMTPAYVHLLIVGWITQLIIGVAYWMFPKYTKDNPRYSDKLAWTTYFTLNAGLLLRLIGEPLAAVQPSSLASAFVVLSALLQLIAGWSFVINSWVRVKER